MYFVYIIKSRGRNYIYKGITQNIDKRLTEHELGQNFSTKGKAPFDLIHVEVCGDRKEARKFERFYKSGWGRGIISEILSERF